LHNEGYEIFIVTDPFTRMAFKSKYDWLQENFPFIDKKNYIFTANKSSIGLDFLIDDGIHNLEVFSGIPLLYDAPYNRKSEKFFRVKNWQDIEHVFDYRLDEVIKFYDKEEC
jgi:5'(3')-deoxyribonucleotidase